MLLVGNTQSDKPSLLEKAVKGLNHVVVVLVVVSSSGVAKMFDD